MRRKAETTRREFQSLSRRLSAFGLVAALSVTGSIAATDVARAESLQDALASAYLYNPTLKAARAQLRATDEGVPRARSGYRPSVSGEVTQTWQKTNPSSGPSTNSEPRSYSVTVNQPIFRGFRTLNAIKGAEALVEAGREDLRAAEQTVLLNAVTAYVDVVRDLSILRLRRNNRSVLQEQLRATQDRFEVGEVTKTDVAQARARVSAASSAISAARATLDGSRAVYAQIIGHPPTNLKSPPVARDLPGSLEEALANGEQENPTILAAIFRERSQDHTIKQAKGELLPSVNVQASYTRNENTATGDSDVTTVTGVLSVPIYQAGEVSARVRQNVETRSQLRHQIDEARESVRANVISAWGSYTAARAQIVSDRAQVEASSVALEGVREEEKVGQRTVLDVLNADQDLLDARVSLATSRRDLVVASYSLLSAIGRLSSTNINLPILQYDPTRHYREVKNKWYGWSTSYEDSSEPEVAPVVATGRTPEQSEGDGPAYTGTTR